LTAAGHSLEAV